MSGPDNLINEITLDCLMNKEQYQKYVLQKNIKKNNLKDIKFYRKRIYFLTKELLLSKEQPKDLLPEVKYAYENYVKTCINYFKVVDRNDIIQEDYVDVINDNDIILSEELNNLDEIIKEDTKKNPDEYLMRQVNIKKNSLDGFVTKKSNNQKELILPKEKNINLKDPSLKNKGIVKKKNITNNYEVKQNNKKISNAVEIDENEKKKNVDE
jgi:hypothetical protein